MGLCCYLNLKTNCGGCEVVSVLAFLSDNPSSNPAEAYSFCVKFVFEKNENKHKEAEVGPLKHFNWILAAGSF